MFMFIINMIICWRWDLCGFWSTSWHEVNCFVIHNYSGRTVSRILDWLHFKPDRLDYIISFARQRRNSRLRKTSQYTDESFLHESKRDVEPGSIHIRQLRHRKVVFYLQYCRRWLTTFEASNNKYLSTMSLDRWELFRKNSKRSISSRGQFLFSKASLFKVE